MQPKMICALDWKALICSVHRSSHLRVAVAAVVAVALVVHLYPVNLDMIVLSYLAPLALATPLVLLRYVLQLLATVVLAVEMAVEVVPAAAPAQSRDQQQAR
ncbi:MAG: hypothetical protein COT73_12905 [Bdellovibrio sp. CG10_big_fil_rev_8_21_14_0_10_47_8]|nr:MAG: hypothetical protein COT73_12905 [Bdellovibrio sp. CG10_big_fil_rev_8_21_14_0_10_47_8]